MSDDPQHPEPVRGDASGAADPATHANQTGQTLQRLRELVLSGEIPPGSRLTELALVERLGVSRTPIRTALQKLENDGLLEAMPHGRGYKLRQFSKDDIWDAIEIHATMEGLAARMAAERGVAPELMARTRALLARIDALLAEPLTVEAFATYMAHNEEFHALLAEMPGSPMVRRQLERATHHPFAAPGTFLISQAQLPQAASELARAQDQHRSIVDAIRRREGSRAEALVREHARLFGRNLMRAIHTPQLTVNLVPGSVKGLL